MKKALLVLFAAAVTFAANASSVKWGMVSGNTISDISSGTAYLIIGSVPTADSLASKESFAVADLGGEVFRTGEFTSGTFLSSAESITSPTGNYNVFMAVISSDGKTAAVSTSTKSMRIAAATTPVNLQWTTANFSVYTAAVPEPCSVALVLLGVAALGLKRKIA
ncbi:MAG: PEP-CTERM sorting domain-containing protein [Kiritimatiellae bacterium]|nr:PEP-CTERM sorting domain-containing protein [Kiritimatiellia bacterium]